LPYSNLFLKISLLLIILQVGIFAQQEVFAQIPLELPESLQPGSVESAQLTEILQPMVAGIFSLENPLLVLFLIPVAGYIILRGDFHQIAHLQIEKVLGICLALLFSGSFLLSPFNDVMLQFVAGIFSLENPFPVLLLLPIAGYIIVKGDFEEVNYQQIQRILSFCVIILLVSSIIIFPFSVSPYFPFAFATNSTGQNVTTSTLTDIDGDGVADIVVEISDEEQSYTAVIGDIDGDGVDDTVESFEFADN